MIHVYFGDGKGKTTAAVGLTVRMAGNGGRVLFAQFMKGGATGELKVLDACNNVTVARCDKEYGFTGGMTAAEKAEITECHNKILEYIIKRMTEFDMIVMDEIFAAYNYGLCDKRLAEKVVAECDRELVLTGREPDEYFLLRADYASEIKKRKHPFDSGITARMGIEY